MPNSNSTENVSTIKGVVGGYFFTAPYGTALPTDNTTALNSAFTCIGYISDDGVTHSKSGSSTSFHDLNGDVIANAMTDVERTMHQKFVEINPAALKEFYGQDNVTVSNNLISIVDKDVEMPERSIVQELVLKDGRKLRRVIPRAKATEWGDLVDVSTELAGFDLTYTKFADDSGVYGYNYLDDAS